MKKIFVLITVLILLFSSLASASFLGGGWNFLITGNVVMEDGAIVLEGEEAPAEAPVVEPGPAPVEGPIYTDQPVTEPQPIQEPISDQPIGEQPISDQPIGEQPTQEPQCWKNGQQIPCNQMQTPGYNQPQPPQSPINTNTGDYKKELYGDSWCANGQCCPDGICDDFERNSKGCPSDCGWGPSTIQVPQQTQNQQQTQESYMSGSCMDSNTLKISQEKCSQVGGNAEIVDISGCQKLNCKMSGSFGGGFGGGQGLDQNNMDSARQKCENLGLSADVKQGMGGYEIECVESGYEEMGYVDQEIDATQALEFVFKLEEIKMKLDEDGDLYNRVDALYDYCKEKGDEDCSNYENALAKMTEASVAIDSLKGQMKTSIEENGKLTVENLYMFKSMTRGIIDDNLMTIAYALLGVDVNLLEESETEVKDCGNDGKCFEEKFKNCVAGSSVSPEDSVNINIVSLDADGSCQIDVEVNGEVINCRFGVGQYKYMPLSKETFSTACGEQMKQIFGEQTINQGQATQEVVGGVGGKEVYCKITSTCDCDEMCEEDAGEDQWCDDCMRFGMCGDGLCEPKVGEDSSSCPADCMGNSDEVLLEIPVEETVEEEPIEEIEEETPNEDYVA